MSLALGTSDPGSGSGPLTPRQKMLEYLAFTESAEKSAHPPAYIAEENRRCLTILNSILVEAQNTQPLNPDARASFLMRWAKCYLMRPNCGFPKIASTAKLTTELWFLGQFARDRLAGLVAGGWGGSREAIFLNRMINQG